MELTNKCFQQYNLDRSTGKLYSSTSTFIPLRCPPNISRIFCSTPSITLTHELLGNVFPLLRAREIGRAAQAQSKLESETSTESVDGALRRFIDCKRPRFNGAQACARLGDPGVKQRRHHVKGEVGLSAIHSTKMQDRQDYTARSLGCGAAEKRREHGYQRERARVKTLTPPLLLISYHTKE